MPIPNINPPTAQPDAVPAPGTLPDIPKDPSSVPEVPPRTPPSEYTSPQAGESVSDGGSNPAPAGGSRQMPRDLPM